MFILFWSKTVHFKAKTYLFLTFRGHSQTSFTWGGHTVISSDWTLKKGPFLILPSSIARNSYKLKTKRTFRIHRGILEIIQFFQFIHLEKHLDVAWATFGKKLLNGTFTELEKKTFGQKKLNSMQGLKSTILAIFQRGPGWPCPVISALKNLLLKLKDSFCFGCPLIPRKTGRQN